MNSYLDFNHQPVSPLKEVPEINALIDAALQREAGTQQARSYLGASRLGEQCLRKLQYEYTHTPKEIPFTGQQLRIFEVGHVYESLSINWLKQAGFDLRTLTLGGEQYGFSVAGGRVQGHIDGVLIGGPDLLKYPALWEHKSMNSKNWRQCTKKGVRSSKPIYFVQMQLYMAYMQLTEHPALFTAVNKDTCELWHELVPFESSVAQYYSDRAVQVITATEAHEWLPCISRDPTHLECKYCSWQAECHRKEKAYEG